MQNHALKRALLLVRVTKDSVGKVTLTLVGEGEKHKLVAFAMFGCAQNGSIRSLHVN